MSIYDVVNQALTDVKGYVNDESYRGAALTSLGNASYMLHEREMVLGQVPASVAVMTLEATVHTIKDGIERNRYAEEALRELSKVFERKLETAKPHLD